MLEVSYSDFFANTSQYKEKAETFGLKILPKKKEKKISRKLQEKINHLNAVVGLVPPEINVDELLIERRMSK